MVSRRVYTLLEQLRAQGVRDRPVLDTFAVVSRKKFIDEAPEHKTWDNITLSTDQGQATS